MGLTNSLATFQAYINKALRGLVDDFYVVYLDNILVFSKTKEEHNQNLQRVCERLRDVELYAKPSKCQFYQMEIEFLGFIIRTQGIRMDLRRVQTIKEWENHPPKSYRDLQVLLGFYNFYRRFIRNYSSIAKPLTFLLKGSQNGWKTGNFSKKWGKPQQQAFLELLGTFQKAPLLHHYNPKLPIHLEANALDAVLRGVLSQLQKDTNKWHPIAFFSKQFKGVEVHYTTPNKELIAIVACFKHWHHYIEGSPHTIKVWSNHQNLQGFMKQPKINSRQAWWLVYLMPYDFIIKHRLGLLNLVDSPLRRSNYKAQAEPSLIQKDILASKLVESNPNLLETVRLSSTLYNIAIAQEELSVIQKDLCNTVKCQLYINLTEVELRDVVRATQRVNAQSPLEGLEGQQASSTIEEAVGLFSKTPIAIVQVLCALP